MNIIKNNHLFLFIVVFLFFLPALSFATPKGTTATTRNSPTPSLKTVYCCDNGQVLTTTPIQCRRKKLKYYKSKKEALEVCKPDTTFCCIDNKVGETTSQQCRDEKGTAYKTISEAKIKCKPEEIYCCLKGKVEKVSDKRCSQKKGHAYTNEKKARENCGWCTVDQHIFPTHLKNCKRLKGVFSQSRHKARFARKKQPQCCIEGQLFPYSQELCRIRRGNYSRNAEEAKNQCKSVLSNLRPIGSNQLQQLPQGALQQSKMQLNSPPKDSSKLGGNASSELTPLNGDVDTPIIIITNKTVVPQSPDLDQEVTASFTVKNIGPVETSGPLPFTLKIYSSDENGEQTFGGSSVYRWHMEQLQPGEEQVLSVSGPMFHYGLHAASLLISLNGNSIPGGYDGDIVIPDGPAYKFFQVLQSYDLGFYGGTYCLKKNNQGVKICIKNYGPSIPQAQHERLGLFLSVNSGAWQTKTMSEIDPSGQLKAAGEIIEFIWSQNQINDDLNTNWHNKREYKFFVTVLDENGNGPSMSNFDSYPGNNKTSITVGGYNDLVICFKKYVYHKQPHRFRYYDVKVKNIGNLPSDYSDLKFYIEKKGTKTYSIPPLQPGEDHSITRKVYWGKKGTKKFKLEVKSTGNLEARALREHLFNNIFKGKIYIKKDPPGPGTILCSDDPDAANLW